MVERQRIDKRSEAQPARALGDGGEKKIRRRSQADRRRVMLRQMVCVEAGSLVCFDQREPRGIKFIQGQRATVEVVKDAVEHSLSKSIRNRVVFARLGLFTALRELSRSECSIYL